MMITLEFKDLKTSANGSGRQNHRHTVHFAVLLAGGKISPEKYGDDTGSPSVLRKMSSMPSYKMSLGQCTCCFLSAAPSDLQQLGSTEQKGSGRMQIRVAAGKRDRTLDYPKTCPSENDDHRLLSNQPPLLHSDPQVRPRAHSWRTVLRTGSLEAFTTSKIWKAARCQASLDDLLHLSRSRVTSQTADCFVMHKRLKADKLFASSRHANNKHTKYQTHLAPIDIKGFASQVPRVCQA